METTQEHNILHTIQKSQYGFGQSLRYIRVARGISLREIARAVGRTPTYISDIERGNNRPPDSVLLGKLIHALALDQASDEIQDYLYDLAARERGEVSGDIIEYIMARAELRKLIRLARQRENDEEIWQDCIRRLQQPY